MKAIFGLVLVLALAIAYVNANCAGKCPDTEEVVWATGGGCSVFRNKCHLDKENCHRKPALQVVSKAECQRSCPQICPALYQPVSGNYKGEIKHFSNACEMVVHSCRTGETFL